MPMRRGKPIPSRGVTRSDVSSNTHLYLAVAFVAAGLYVLAWSADRFVEGAESVARALGVSPFRDVSPLVFTRDLPVMVILTLSIGIFGFSFRRPRSPGTITRICGIIWLAGFLVYLAVLILQEAFTA